MDNRLTQEQLSKVVAEAERLSQSRDNEVDREQVKEILKELNLSPDLLDDALVQVQRRDALEVQQRRNRWIIGGVAIALIGTIAAATVFSQGRQSAIANVKAAESCVTLSQDSCSNLAAIDRQANREVFYRVTLQQAPVGEQLSLKCDWIDPSNRVVHQNSYSTRQINKSVWPTSCRHNVGSAAAIGNWKVQMSAGDRVLSSTNFEVK